MVRLLPVLKGLAGLVGLAVYVQLVGGAVLWVRFHEAQIPELQTIQVLSPQYLLSVGISSLFLPLLAGAAAAGLQYVLAPTNPKGTLPPRFGFVVFLLTGFAIWMACFRVSGLEDFTRWLLVVLALLGAWAVWTVAARTKGFVSLALILFVYGAIFGGCFKIVRELDVEPQFDIGVAFRGEDRDPVAGLYLGRTDSDVVMARITPKRGPRPAEEWQTIVIPKDQVTTLAFGPRSRPAEPSSQSEADDIAKALSSSGLDQPAKATETRSKEVFVVHGHNRTDEVSGFLRRSLGERPIVLMERPGKGRTIIEKFEDEAKTADFAVVLLTADDLGGSASGGIEVRARQNVFIELGYFISALGRDHVAVLREEGVNIPSDISGVEYIPFSDGWRAKLKKELVAAGIKGKG
jgi:predicted nucleotide-binding protein